MTSSKRRSRIREEGSAGSLSRNHLGESCNLVKISHKSSCLMENRLSTDLWSPLYITTPGIIGMSE